jgi:hypothetical protein
VRNSCPYGGSSLRQRPARTLKQLFPSDSRPDTHRKMCGRIPTFTAMPSETEFDRRNADIGDLRMYRCYRSERRIFASHPLFREWTAKRTPQALHPSPSVLHNSVGDGACSSALSMSSFFERYRPRSTEEQTKRANPLAPEPRMGLRPIESHHPNC